MRGSCLLTGDVLVGRRSLSQVCLSAAVSHDGPAPWREGVEKTRRGNDDEERGHGKHGPIGPGGSGIETLDQTFPC
jgi:hypothetical protein